MNNRWLSFLIVKVEILVPTMNDVAYLHRKHIQIYGLKPNPEGGYLVTVGKGALHNLDISFTVHRTLSIYPNLARFALPILAVFFTMMALMSRYTIGYKITGNLNPEQVQELEVLLGPHFQQVGPFEFLLTDKEQISEDIKAFYDEYTYFDVFRDGNNITIQIYQMQEGIPGSDTSYSSTLYARRTGEIQQVNVKTGRSLVSPGQLIREGDRLITHTVLDPTGSNTEISTNRVVQGEVWAHTWYLADVSFPIQYLETVLTTRMETRRTLNMFGFSWNFPNRDVDYEDFSTQTRRIDPFFFLENSPLFLETIHYYEKSDIMKVNDAEEIKQHAKSLIKNEFARQTGQEFELVDLRIIATSELENQVTLQFHVTILENIAH